MKNSTGIYRVAVILFSTSFVIGTKQTRKLVRLVSVFGLILSFVVEFAGM